MPLKNHHVKGDEWDLPDGRHAFVMELSGGMMLFQHVRTDKPYLTTEANLMALHASRQARRIDMLRRRDGQVQNLVSLAVPPEGASDKARSRFFFCKEWDRQPCALSDRALEQFVADRSGEASKQGIVWKPSPGALRRALKERGTAGARPLAHMANRTGRRKGERWARTVQNALDRAVAWYYANGTRTQQEAYARLARMIAKVNGLAAVRFDTWITLPLPSPETFRLRILKAESEVTIAARLGEREARRRYRAVLPGQKADHILDVVMIDGTVVDGWCVLDDETRTPLGRPYLTIAIDLKSRCILGIVISFDGESLDSIAECVQQVVAGKHAIIGRLPHFAPILDDLYGKPETIVVDNAWRQVGRSFQDACEDVGISVEWAPVANPEYKGVVERIFHTLNKLLFHKLPGGVPFDPVTMRKLGFDPSKTAAITLSRLEELIYQAVHTIYHDTPHRTLGIPPLLAWRKGLAARARKIVGDVGFLESAMGTVADAVLTREGVRFKGITFHDPEITGALLADLAGTTPVRARRKRYGSATANVKIKWRESSIAAISVWNPKAQPDPDYVRLPNADEAYAKSTGLGFSHHARVEAYAQKESLDFQSSEDRLNALYRLRAEIQAAAPDMKFRDVRQQRRLLTEIATRRDTVEVVTERATSTGLGPGDVRIIEFAKHRRDGGRPEKGPRRGGRPKVRRTVEVESNKVVPLTQPIDRSRSGALVDDPAAFMAELERKMAAARNGEDR